MKYDLKKFDMSDLQVIDCEEIRKQPNPYYFEHYWSRENTVFSLWHDGEVLCVGGAITVHLGVGEAFMFCKDRVNGDRFRIARAAKELMDYIFNQCPFHRLQARAETTDIINNRFLLFLGFEREALLKKYGFNGEDYYLYSRI